MGGGEGLHELAATRPRPWELPQLESGECRAWSAVRCARWRGGALTWVFSRPRQCSGARHIHAPSLEIRLLCGRTARSAWAIDCPVGTAVQAAQLRRGSRAALPRALRAFLPAPAARPAHVRLLCPPASERALVEYPAQNLLPPPGGLGWGQVSRDLIGAGGSPGRTPNPQGELHLGIY